MQYTFTRGDTTENVALERWAWGVISKQDTELLQFGADGVFHQFKEIDQKNAKLFVMYKPLEAGKRIDIVVPDGAQLFHFYRTIGDMNNKEWVRKIYVFGYKSERHTAYHYILPDDRLVVSATDDIDLTKFAL